jgi:molybdate transport system permease protein
MAKLTIFQTLDEYKIKIVTILSSLMLTFFILSLIFCIVTHTTLPDLFTSIQSTEIQFAIQMSLLTSVISTLLCIIVSLPAAYALARYNFFGKSFVNTLLDAPLALPPLVSGVGLLLLFGTTSFGSNLAAMGLQFVFTPLGIVIAQFFVNMPFMFRILRGTFQDINPRYERVAETLGCTELQSIWRVTLPMAKNGLLAASVITWSRGIGEFGAALMVAGATRLKTETLPVSLYLNMSCGELSLAIASATVLIIISIVSLFIFERYGGSGRAF